MDLCMISEQLHVVCGIQYMGFYTGSCYLYRSVHASWWKQDEIFHANHVPRQELVTCKSYVSICVSMITLKNQVNVKAMYVSMQINMYIISLIFLLKQWIHSKTDIKKWVKFQKLIIATIQYVDLIFYFITSWNLEYLPHLVLPTSYSEPDLIDT